VRRERSSWLSRRIRPFERQRLPNTSIGFSHLLAANTVLSVDYLHVRLYNGWNTEQINPLIDHDNNPATPRVRGLAAELQRVFGDPTLLGPDDGPHLEELRRLRRHRRPLRAPLCENSITGKYTLAWARGTLGSLDFTTQGEPSRLPHAMCWSARSTRRMNGVQRVWTSDTASPSRASCRCGGASTWHLRSRPQPPGRTRSTVPRIRTGTGSSESCVTTAHRSARTMPAARR
jgi:hypothetical protein